MSRPRDRRYAPRVTSKYEIEHEGDEIFALSPSALWTEFEDVERFESWWSWLGDLKLEPRTLATGSVMTFAIETPLPYRMQCRVEMTDVVEAESITARVSGDLQGWATLQLYPEGAGTRVVLRWALEPTQLPLRLLVRAARPLIVRTKDWAVDHALSVFRRKVESAD